MKAKEQISFCPFEQCASLFSKTVGQMVACRRLKTVENSKTLTQKSHEKLVTVPYWRWSFTRGFSMSSTEDIFGVLGRWSLMEGGRTWRFDCTFKKEQTSVKPSCWAICLFRQQGVSLLNFVFNFVGLIVVCVPSSP